MGFSKLTSLALGLTLVLTGCSVNSTTEDPDPTPTIDSSLIPQVPAEGLVDVSPDQFLTSYGDVIFKVGDGPTWCTMSEFDDFVICEHKEFDAKYQQLERPADCEYTYGYQMRLRGSEPVTGKIAEFTCANAAWSDASLSPKLESGQRIIAFGFRCFVQGTAARCENQTGDFIALGPEAWAMSD
jgi:hypothetical protein